MNKLLYILGFFLFAALHLRALKIQSGSSVAMYEQIGDALSEKLSTRVDNHFNSFLDTVTDKVYDKFEGHLSNPRVAEKMMILLENDAELLHIPHYKSQNLALIQSQFFKKLREKFKNSKFGKKLTEWGKKIGSKLKDMYKKHAGKLKILFKTIMKGMVLPLAVAFAKKNAKYWRSVMMKALSKLKGKTGTNTRRVFEKLFDKFDKKLKVLSEKYKLSDEKLTETAKEMAKKEGEVVSLEKEEAKLKEQAKAQK